MKFTIVIPTMYFYRMLDKMLPIYSALDCVEEILIVNNNKGKYISYKHIPKVREIGNGINLFVNPSWKFGIQESKTDNVVLINDDIIIEEQPLEPLFDLISSVLKENMVIGCSMEQETLEIKKSSKLNYGFGIFMFIKKETYLETPIPEEIKVWYGDTILHHYQEAYTWSGIKITTPMRGTSSKLNLKGVNQKERIIYKQLISRLPSKFSENSIKTLNVLLTLKKSKEFSVKDVFLLANNLKKRTKQKVSIICMVPEISKEYTLNGVLFIPAKNWNGWWIKMNMFSPITEKYRPFLFMDLDTAITGDIKEVIPTLKDEEKFVTLEDFYRKGKLASGLMWIPKNNVKVRKIWNEWIKNPVGNMRRFRGDQEFIGSFIKSDTFWQTINNRIGTFKPKRQGLLKDTNGYDIVCFHGKPKIWEASRSVEWVKEYCDE